MTGYERRTEEKRRRILQSAREIFGRYGFKKVTVEEIAAAAEVSKVTIYSYFRSKMGLIEALVDESFSARKVAIENLVHSDASFLDKIRDLTLQKTEASVSYSKEFLAHLTAHPAWRDQSNDDVRDLMAELMDQGKREGYVSQGADPESLLLYLDLFRRGTEARAESLSSVSEDVFRQVIAMMFHGLSAPV